MSIALLFPGQGSQYAGMLQHLPQTPAAVRTYRQACDTLSRLHGVPALLDSAEALESTTNTQLALHVAAVVTARALIDDHGLPIDAVAGHSVGAFAAAVISGVLGLDDALRVLQIRGAGMERACAGGSWTMAALRGLPARAVQRILDQVGTRTDPLWIANINTADQIVVSGTRTAIETLRRHAPAAGATSLTVLEVAIASHCPLQAETARNLADALADVVTGKQRCAYFANTTGRRILHAPRAILDDLAQAVRQPVRWYDAVRLMPEVEITATVQVPPGHVLTHLVARQNPSMTNIALDDIGITAAVHRARHAIGP
ncbi:Malonyl CoA-acyl carrier protein transacylase [Streptomyces sp. MBT84]|uniref:ACP S-malonyltransferase n=1 Tax=unclassified Streptomyces TaxID=2593676 RepID=UPI001C6E64E3|nr:acyltransferase domain-containing protein [Streptomyces sp. MBT84]MBW8705490.1 Malonyl CoA-acyl carrier protein transacylase [Streptomyces sp. MBT84]